MLVWAPRSCLGTTFMWRTAVLVRDRVSAHRKRLRSHGLRPVQMWGPDVRGDDVATQARRQAKAVARSSTTSDDQELVAAISTRWDASVPTAPRRGDFVTAAAPLMPLPRVADASTGIASPSSAMIDKITTVRRANVGEVRGRWNACRCSNSSAGSRSSWVWPMDERELMNVSESGARAGALRVDGFPCD